MPRPISLEDQMNRKKASMLVCLDKNGKPLNDASKSVAVQDKKDSTDINRIVAKGIKNGLIRDNGISIQVDPVLTQRTAVFGNFTNAVDYQTQLNRVIAMKNEFMKLNPKVRMRFDNDPVKLVEFLSDPKNKKESIELGLRVPPKIETKRLETPEGDFWLTLENGTEISRDKIKAAAPTPGA